MCGNGWTIGGNRASIKNSLLVLSYLLLGVLSLVTVQPTAAPVAKQLLPKTLGPSNVNVAAHMQHLPHMVSDVPHNYYTAWSVRLFSFLSHICVRAPNISTPLKSPSFLNCQCLLTSNAVLLLCKPLHYHCEVTS